MSDESDNTEAREGQPLAAWMPDDAGAHQTLKDARLMSRAIRERWPIDEGKRAAIITRLCRIVDKDEVSTVDKQGGVQYDEEKADRNAIAAARVLVAMIGQNQKDEQPRIQQAPVVNVGVQVNGNPDGSRITATAIAERIRIGRMAGNLAD